MGFLVYTLSKSKKIPSSYKTKDFLLIITEILSVFFLISFYISFISMKSTLEEKIIFVSSGIIIPITFAISMSSIFLWILIKNEKKFFYSSMSILFSYIFLVISSGLFDANKKFISSNNYELIIFLIMYLVLMELGLKTINFEHMIKKIIKDRKYINKDIIRGMNKLFNKNISFIFIFAFISILIAYIITHNKNFLDFIQININTGTIGNILLFTIITVSIPLFLLSYMNKYEDFNLFKNFLKKKNTTDK